MPSLRRVFFASTLAVALLCLPAFTPAARAQDHLVTSQALQQQVQSASAARRQNIDTLTRFLSTSEAESAMQAHHINPVQVRSAIPSLSNQELASLASRAAQAQQQFAAGFLGMGMLLVIIIAIVVVIIVVAVH
jgi:hypothetical protein